VLALHYLAGYSEAELAVACGVSPATIKRRLREAREQAKRKLLPVVRELLALQPRSETIVEPTMPRKAGCACARILTAGRCAAGAAQ
jgi:transposase